MSIFLRAAELNEETTRCLQEFPKEMIFHLSSLHLLESVGQGTKNLSLGTLLIISTNNNL